MKKFVFERLKKHKERFPSLLSIEFTSICNAKCIMCPHVEMERVKENMPFEILEKVVQDCKGKSLKKVNLFWLGDSFCHREILDYLRYVRKELKGVKLYISTNASLLSEKRTRAIIDENLIDVINFDIDGFKKETYEKIRLSLKFDKVVQNVRFFAEYRKEQKKKKPQTRVTIINMKPNTYEIDDFVKYWSPLVDKVDVNKYNTWLGTQQDLNVGESLEKSQQGGFDFACTHPWDELVIGADGRAGLCCLDYELEAEVGDVMQNSIEEIWQSKQMNWYRDKMLKNEYDEIDVCKNCNAYIYQQNTTWAKLQR
jgi:radical SAM protein with 4Fe4S-binding SPASM domain